MPIVDHNGKEFSARDLQRVKNMLKGALHGRMILVEQLREMLVIQEETEPYLYDLILDEMKKVEDGFDAWFVQKNAQEENITIEDLSYGMFDMLSKRAVETVYGADRTKADESEISGVVTYCFSIWLSNNDNKKFDLNRYLNGEELPEMEFQLGHDNLGDLKISTEKFQFRKDPIEGIENLEEYHPASEKLGNLYLGMAKNSTTLQKDMDELQKKIDDGNYRDDLQLENDKKLLEKVRKGQFCLHAAGESARIHAMELSAAKSVTAMELYEIFADLNTQLRLGENGGGELRGIMVTAGKISGVGVNELPTMAYNTMVMIADGVNQIKAQKDPAMRKTMALQLAAFANTTLISEHIFEDGNGRSCRMMADTILMTFGLPPHMPQQEETKIANTIGTEPLDYAAAEDAMLKGVQEASGFIKERRDVAAKENTEYIDKLKQQGLSSPEPVKMEVAGEQATSHAYGENKGRFYVKLPSKEGDVQGRFIAVSQQQIEERAAGYPHRNPGVAYFQMSKLLGVEKLVPEAREMEINVDGKLIPGQFLAEAKGKSLVSVLGQNGEVFQQEDMVSDSLKDLADLQVLNYLCGIPADQAGNVNLEMTTGASSKCVGVYGNGSSVAFEASGYYNKIHDRQIPQGFNMISVQMAAKVQGMNLKDYRFVLQEQGLKEEEIQAAVDRLTDLQYAISQQKIKIVSGAEFKQKTFQELTEGNALFEQISDRIVQGPVVNYDEDEEFLSEDNPEAKGYAEGKVVDSFDPETVEQNRKEALESFSIRKLAEETMLSVRKPITERELSENYVKAVSDTFDRMYREVLDADSIFIKSSPQYYNLRTAITDARKQIHRIQREVAGGRAVTEDNVQDFADVLQNVSSKAEEYSTYKVSDLESKGKEPNARESARINAANLTKELADRMLGNSRIFEEDHKIMDGPIVALNNKLNTAVNNVNLYTEDEDRIHSIAEAIYLSTVQESSYKEMSEDQLSTALQKNVMEQNVQRIIKSESFQDMVEENGLDGLGQIAQDAGAEGLREAYLKDMAAEMQRRADSKVQPQKVQPQKVQEAPKAEVNQAPVQP